MKKDLIKLRERVLAIRKEVRDLSEEHSAVLAQLQAKCSHESVVECDYDPGGVLCRDLPPARKCLICGVIEEGWGVGYKKLTATPVRTVYRADFVGKEYDLPDLKSQLVPKS